LNKPNHRTIAVLNMPRTVGALVTYAQGIVTAMTGNPSFPTPAPALATVKTAIDDLQKAETVAQARTKGAVSVRNEKRTALVTLLRQMVAHVQTVADANVENAVSIIESAGIGVKKAAARKPRTFDAAPGAIAGSAKLVAASAGNRASYEWQYSLDAGHTWVTAPSTLQSKTTIPGLTVGATVLFRYRPVVKTGEGNWSQTVSLVIK
jgi:hypothetical protein